jgi:hypothetical protein
MEWLYTGFGLVTGIVEHLQIVTTNTCNRCTNSHNLQFTRAHTEVFSAFCIFISRCLVAISNGGRSPFSGFPNYPRPQLPASNSDSSQRLCRSSPLTLSLSLHWLILLIIFRHGPHRKHFLCCCVIDVFVSIRVPTYSVLSHCLQRSLFAEPLRTSVVQFLISRSLRSNGFKGHSLFNDSDYCILAFCCIDHFIHIGLHTHTHTDKIHSLVQLHRFLTNHHMVQAFM